MVGDTRHAQGEYYTPRWLAELILDEAGYDGAPGTRLLDPTCGEGVFLVAAIERAKARGGSFREPPRETARRILADIHGLERNPTTAKTARANYRAALADLAAYVSDDEIPVRAADAILEHCPGPLFDYVVGNPPWVRWDHLPVEYREATLPLWKRYGLFSLKGFQALLGGGKKDLSMLVTYVAADRYLRIGGRLAFLITQEVFKSKGAGEGFRRFRLGEDGPPLGVIAAHDFVGLRPFPDAANKTAAIVLTKGAETEYPAPYFVWTRGRGGSLEKRALEARPLGSPAGPWQTLDPRGPDVSFLDGPNAYTPVLGANANPYGVFWLEMLKPLPGGLVEVRNLPEMGKSPIPAVTAVLESELVYPALRGADIRPWGAASRVHVLLVQDPAIRAGHAEATLRERWPRTLEYLGQFRDLLLSRALYRRYHREKQRPFYSQFNVAGSAFTPFKVVWKRMSNELAAAVVSAGPGAKLLIPLETTSFIGVASAEEAHYLCAVLNSASVRLFVKSFSAAGRGFGTPSAIARVRIPRFDASNSPHLRLAEISKELHQAQGAHASARAAELDALVRSL